MSENFRELIEQVRRRGRQAHEPPVPMIEVAEQCELSCVHLYNLIAGRRPAPDWRAAAIARALGLTIKRVREALEQTQSEETK